MYSEDQVRNALQVCGLRVYGITGRTFITQCPFHGNYGSPAFNVARDGRSYNCHNPSCDAHGNLVQLVMACTKTDYHPAQRLIGSNSFILDNIDERVEYNLSDTGAFPSVPQEQLDALASNLWASDRALDYLRGRNFTDATLEKFGIGYSEKQDMTIVPMHDIKGNPIGFVGRSIEGKAFKNSTGLPKSQTLFNIHRAIRAGADSVIICESSFDVMRLDQCGYPNSVAILGGGFNEHIAAQIGRHFSTAVIMTDNDDSDTHKYHMCRVCREEGYGSCQGHNPGESLGEAIEAGLPGKMIKWAHCGGVERYPEGIKDIGNMSDTLIRQCIKGAQYSFEYA